MDTLRYCLGNIFKNFLWEKRINFFDYFYIFYKNGVKLKIAINVWVNL